MRFGRAQQGDHLLLGLRNLYILPTRFGWLWLCGAVLLYAVGIQTLRNGPLLLSYLMLALLLLALLLTQFNLQGLDLRCGTPAPGFVGGVLRYPIQTRSSLPREGITLQWLGGPGTAVHTLPVAEPQRIPAGSSCLELFWTPLQRGAHRPGRLVLSSTAPLGLFICWTRWDPPARQLVYPGRLPGPVALAGGNPGEAQQAAVTAEGGPEGSAAWHDLRPHRAEDGQARLAWKALAQGRGRLSKVFHDPGRDPLQLAPAAGVGKERALEHLSERICRCSQRGETYGLVLPHLRIAPGQGRQHRDRCLEALALAP
ncbi:conserved hypothetical protein [Cyanobium sp. PCC 7001]|uniref:hypothetical protein n=1 Tax=Cyanobium sp. PCC 7001 TaxID=180281 RepID=UPI00018056F2|nr:hypothetical protein [Cyanobium sp. PCC 7001]EDY37239.1 conserved hypothetical protein [Cyanobium sp. PCC 7001]